MGALIVLIFTLAVAVAIACSPSEPTVDVQATVEAGIQSTKEAEASVESTVTARLEATKVAEPTPTATPEPTHTPRPTRAAVVIAETIVPQGLEKSETTEKAERLFDCMVNNPAYAALYKRAAVQNMVAQGMTEEAAGGTMELLTANRELFSQGWQQAIDTGQSTTDTLETEVRICETDTTARKARVTGAEELASALYTCLLVNQEYWERFRSNLIASMRHDGVEQVAAEDLAAFMMSTPENFRTFIGEAVKVDPTLHATVETGLQDCTDSLGQTQAPSERDILVIFYEATGGPNWKNNENWLSNKPIGEWYGVTTDESGRVIELVRAFAHGMTGEIPPEIGRLRNLRRLVITGSELKGAIPPEIGNLSKLEELILSFNELTGEIPPELGQLGNLKLLSLMGNNLYGAIPTELVNLRNLEGLNLSINVLEGRIPAELGKLRKLGGLSLNNNLLRGEIPPELGNLENLIALIVHDNFLIGQLPTELGNLSSLEQLGIFNTGITGCIPSPLQDQLTGPNDLPFCPLGSQ